MTRGTDSLHFFYDAQSRPAKVCFNGVMYTYVHNLQGDVTGILDNEGNLVVEYKYDAWGKLLSSAGTLVNTLGMYNLFRYKGYIYDDETGLYYLRSRYYSDEWDRFINEDITLGSIGQLMNTNLYAYCNNSPIVYLDYNGKEFKSALKMFMGITVLLTSILLTAVVKRETINKRAGRKLVSTSEVLKSMFLPIRSGTMREIERNNGFWANNREILLCYPKGKNSIICYTINKYGSTFVTEYYYHAASLNSDWQTKKVLDYLFQFSEDQVSSGIIESFTSPWYSVIGYIWMSISEYTLPEDLFNNTIHIYWQPNDPLKPPSYL